jgi:hypothetical protein
MDGYYITANNPTVKVPIEPISQNDFIDLHRMDIIELVLPLYPTYSIFVDCSLNKLKELFIPPGYKKVWCAVNQLTKLTLPIGCKLIDCRNNYLKELYVPRSCKEVYCFGNNLHPQIEELFQSDDPVKIALANNLQIANNQ